MLAGFDPAGRDWTGDYWCFDCNPIYHTVRFHFGIDGSWSFYDDGTLKGTGQATLTSWPDHSLFVGFKLCPSCSEISMAYPWGSFLYRNGPPDWPLIEYTGH